MAKNVIITKTARKSWYRQGQELLHFLKLSVWYLVPVALTAPAMS